MFMRESSGIYNFGKIKIHVKIERDKLLVKTGAGYLHIDEFVDQ